MKTFCLNNSLSTDEILSLEEMNTLLQKLNTLENRVSSRRVSRSGGGLKILCIKIGYGKPSRAESPEGSSAVAESSRVT